MAVPSPSLQFVYKPSHGFAPIHEIDTGRNERIKAFYWKLWYGDDEVLPAIGIRDKFVGPEVTILAEDVEQFCAVVGNRAENFKTARNENVQAPMDFALVTGWQVRFLHFLFSFFMGLIGNFFVGYHEVHLPGCYRR